MNTNELKKLMMPLHDGELDPATAAEVEEALAASPEAQADLAELRLINAFASDAFTASPEVADVDLSGVYDGVMARIAAEEASIEGVRVQREADEGMLDRFMGWLGELFRFERPMAAMASMAALLAIVGGVWFAQNGSSGEAVDPDVSITANDGDAPKRMRRAAEGEVKVQSTAVDAIADKGELKVIELDDEDESALVLWHVVDGEGVALPANGNGTGL